MFFHGDKFHRDRHERQSRRRVAAGMSEQPGSTATSAQVPHREGDQVPSHRPLVSAPQATPRIFDPALVAEFTSRGITEERAIALLTNVKPGRDVVAQLEHAEQSVKNSKIEIRNPAAYIARLIELNTPVPDGFETRAQQKAREEREQKERARRDAKEAEQQLEWDYQDYRASEIDRYIEANRAAFEAIKEAKWKADRERFSFSTESMAVMSARYEISKQMSFLTFEEFLDRRKQGTDFSLKSVAPSPFAEPEMVSDVALPQGVVVTDEASSIPPDPPLMAEERGEATQPAPEAARQPAISGPEPAIELVSEPRQQEPGGDAAGMGMV